MNLETSHFLLRNFNQGDLEYVYRGLSDPKVIIYYGVSFNSLAATQEQIDWYAKIETENTGRWRAICSPDGRTFFGALGINDWDQVNGVAQIGYWLLPEYWGKGIMREVFPVFLNFAFNILKLNRIEAEVETLNINSRKLLISNGFIFEETKHDCEFKYGKYISLDIFSRNSSEIKTLKEFYTALNSNDTQAALSLFDSQILRIEFEGTPMAGTFRGLAEMEAHLSKGRETWAEGTCEPESFNVVGNKIIVRVHVHVRQKDKSEWIDGYVADGYHFKNGKIVEFRSFLDNELALKWATP